MSDSRNDLRRAARIAGLRSFHTPSLEAVEKRRFQLWVLSLVLLLAVAAAVILLTLLDRAVLPAWLTPGIFYGGLLGLVSLFCAYAIEKELQLRRLTRLLVEEKVLTAALTNRLREVSALLEAGKALNLDLDLDQVLATILRCAQELLDGRDASIQLVHGRNELRTVKVAGASGAIGACIAFGEGVAGRVAETREAILIDGHLDHPEERDPSAPPPSSAMSVPLIHREELLGVLNLNARADRTYTRHDLRALSVFGEQAAIAIVNAQLYESQRLSATQVSYRALHDPLTGLANRGLFLDRLQLALARRRDESKRVAVLFVDLDDFKRINDSLGHGVGDEVLSAVGDRLRSTTRAADTVARFGGDEFAVLLEDVEGEEEAWGAARRIVAALETPIGIGSREITIGVSIGIATRNVDGREGSEDLMRNADIALHAAKQDRKGTIQAFEDSMHLEALLRLETESDLAKALENRELEVHYQPIWTLPERRIVAVEALLRWRHPTRGLLAAASFVPQAEQSGLLPALDRWLLEVACRLGTTLDDDLRIQLNLSPSRLREPGLVDEVAEALEQTGLSPSRLTFEITEHALLRESEAAGPLSRFRTLGVRLALDDFGTGYSSLAHLSRLPVDSVKIDRLFVDEVDRLGEGGKLVEAIIRMGQGLSLEVVAEGVERETQLEALQRVGCHMAQGFLLARPMGEEDLRRLLAE